MPDELLSAGQNGGVGCGVGLFFEGILGHGAEAGGEGLQNCWVRGSRERVLRGFFLTIDHTLAGRWKLLLLLKNADLCMSRVD